MTESESQLINFKVKQDMMTLKVDGCTAQLDKMVDQQIQLREDMDVRKEESFHFTQDIAKQIKDNLSFIARQMDQSKSDVQDKIKSLLILLDKGDKSLDGKIQKLRQQIESQMRVKIEIDGGGIMNETAWEEEERQKILGQNEDKVSVNDQIQWNLQKNEAAS